MFYLTFTFLCLSSKSLFTAQNLCSSNFSLHTMLRCSACRYCCGKPSTFIFLVLKRTSLYTHNYLLSCFCFFLSCILLEYGIKETKIPSVLFNNWHTFSDKGQVTTLGLMDHRVFVTSTKKPLLQQKAASDKGANKRAQ